jgi:hypothetical protein
VKLLHRYRRRLGEPMKSARRSVTAQNDTRYVEGSYPMISITNLWISTDRQAWEQALERYWTFVRAENRALEEKLEALQLDRLRRMDARQWYNFLYNEYFPWKYTAPNRLASTRPQLERYQTEARIEDLNRIRERLLAIDPAEIRPCLEAASGILGLGTAGASGLLALMYPEHFGTVDQFVVKALAQIESLPERGAVNAMDPERLSISDAEQLIRIFRRKAADNNREFGSASWTPRKVDKVLWTYGRGPDPKPSHRTLMTTRFDKAFRYAHQLHRRQHRKGTSIPYIAHLMAVASLVLDNGGDEDQAIAALLHDAAEDQGGEATLAKIRSRFGDIVADIVSDCTDAWTDPKPEWRARKETYLRDLPMKPKSSMLVSLADKTHNAEAILFDFQSLGDDLWARFNGGMEGTRWYYNALVDVFSTEMPGPLSARLRRAVAGFLDGELPTR